MSPTLDIVWAGTTLRLHADGSLFLPEHNAVLIADVHLGKSAYFRREGIPTPKGVHRSGMAKLAAALQRYPEATVYLLGDLFHGTQNDETAELRRLVASLPQKAIYLVVGNHDYDVPNWPEIITAPSVQLGALLLLHEPPGSDFDRQQPFDENLWLAQRPQGATAVLCGHLHPAALLRGKGRTSTRIPSFYFNHWLGVLPAFGAFTGMKALKVPGQFYGLVENTLVDLGGSPAKT